MFDSVALDASLAALTTQVAKTETVEDSAVALLQGQAAAIVKAVTDALTADNAADQDSIDAAVAAITAVATRFTTSGDKLGAAVIANTPSA